MMNMIPRVRIKGSKLAGLLASSLLYSLNRPRPFKASAYRMLTFCIKSDFFMQSDAKDLLKSALVDIALMEQSFVSLLSSKQTRKIESDLNDEIELYRRSLDVDVGSAAVQFITSTCGVYPNIDASTLAIRMVLRFASAYISTLKSRDTKDEIRPVVAKLIAYLAMLVYDSKSQGTARILPLAVRLFQRGQFHFDEEVFWFHVD